MYTFFLLSPADNRPLSAALDLYVHGARLASRNRIFINLWRPNAENVEVTIFMAMYSLRTMKLITSSPSSTRHFVLVVRAEPLVSLSVTFVREL